ncbi:TPA: hypothetical protein QCY49_000020 [Bacillus paranthracis]|nr:hypothetical protein [Bacillus paranthracis]
MRGNKKNTVYHSVFYFDKKEEYGVEVSFEPYGLIYRVLLKTCNVFNKEDKSHHFYLLRNPFSSQIFTERIQKKVSLHLRKLHSHYKKWGVPEDIVGFPWKQEEEN